MENKYDGLTYEEVRESRKKYGSNELEKKKKESIFMKMIMVLKEPTLLLLLLSSLVYFFLGEITDGIVMLISAIITCGIEFISEYRTDKALEELNKMSSLSVKVVRNGKEVMINSEEVVVDDILLLSEGDTIPADGVILKMSGFGVNESSLTGESLTVYKTIKDTSDNHFRNNMCYSGTSVVNGSAIVKVTAVGLKTEYGKIGHSLNNIEVSENYLQKQINNVVKIYGSVSGLLFVTVFFANYFNNMGLVLKERIIESFIAGITIAIATIPEEIPVILVVFLALGSLTLARKRVLTKNMRAVENLGKITVLCTDKTGTLTENRMKVVDEYIVGDNFYNTLYYACAINPYDPMEIAIQEFTREKMNDYELFKTEIIHEYIFNNIDKMMGQIIELNKKKVLCVKGGYENIIKLCDVTSEERDLIKQQISKYASNGLRVLAVASSDVTKIEDSLKDYKLKFLGLVALEDPIRKGIKTSIEKCYSAGIRVIMITGDNEETAKGIAKKINLANYDEVITGASLEKMSDHELKEQVKNVNIFARVYPDHKLRIIKALQENEEVVAMTGDGINDATALKKADIGIAMGERGTNVSKEAADIILLDDNFNTIVSGVENGRTIYNNIKKAILYILTIHIPIALLALVIPLMGLPNMLIPIHIVLLELVIDPVSSIIFQRNKPSKDIMERKPRSKHEQIITLRLFSRCLLEGIIIFLVVFFTYKYYLSDIKLATSMAFTLLVLLILFSANTIMSNDLTIKNIISNFKDRLMVLINILLLIILGCFIYVPKIANIANMSSLSIDNLLIILIEIILTITIFDLFKFIKKKGL